ncbi:hypothetical protein LOZ66_003193 [Ophidiomyces ophidiicola]|nr:hypothetical protein LOZ66_003193 [Ophidiomyces ophidiicola]
MRVIPAATEPATIPPIWPADRLGTEVEGRIVMVEMGGMEDESTSEVVVDSGRVEGRESVDNEAIVDDSNDVRIVADDGSPLARVELEDMLDIFSFFTQHWISSDPIHGNSYVLPNPVPSTTRHDLMTQHFFYQSALWTRPPLRVQEEHDLTWISSEPPEQKPFIEIPGP